MSFSNERGQYGNRPRSGPHLGADPTSAPSGTGLNPLLIGGIGLAVAIVGIAALGARAQAKQQPRLTAHEKEMRAWEAEFPGLPWYADQVKDSRQLDMWERARDHWERKAATEPSSARR